MIRFLTLFVLFLCVAGLVATRRAAAQDTSQVRSSGVTWFLPPVAMASGTSVDFVPAWHEGLNDRLRSAMQGWRTNGPMQGAGLHVDDWLQYAPVASLFAARLCGVAGAHGFGQQVWRSALSYTLVFAVTQPAKYGLVKLRPDGSAHNSFPSGHTATAFAGAELLRQEYGARLPWLCVAGYAVATLTGVLRIYNNRHWLGDVVAGAGVGVLSVQLSYRLTDWFLARRQRPSAESQAFVPLL